MDSTQSVAQDLKATSRKKKSRPKNKNSADSFQLLNKNSSSPPNSPQKQQANPHSENSNKSALRASSLKKNSHKQPSEQIQPVSSSSPSKSEMIVNSPVPSIASVTSPSQPQRRKSRRSKQKSATPLNHSNVSSDSADEKTLNQDLDVSPKKNFHERAESTPKPVRRLSSPDFPSTPLSLSSSTLYQQSTTTQTTPQFQKSNFYAGAYFENSPAPSALPIPSFTNRTTPNSTTTTATATQSQSLPTTIHNNSSRTTNTNPHNRRSQHFNFHQTQNNPFYSPAPAPIYEPTPQPKLHPSTSTPALNSFIDHGYATYPGGSGNGNAYPFLTAYLSTPSPTLRDAGPDMFVMEDDGRVRELKKRSQDLLTLLGAAREKREVVGGDLERTLKDILKIQG
ncbi:hypothetical protein HK096_004717 [Nowakowskiella sp. JEL0078]|nr:hypothetical protein HK096_004717 [Nowakowskiella sp. JEL0078]